MYAFFVCLDRIRIQIQTWTMGPKENMIQLWKRTTTINSGQDSNWKMELILCIPYSDYVGWRLLTRTKMRTLVSPMRYLPSDTRIIGNWVGHWHSDTRSRTWDTKSMWSNVWQKMPLIDWTLALRHQVSHLGHKKYVVKLVAKDALARTCKWETELITA